MTRYHQHYHAHGSPGDFRLTVCWNEGRKDCELLLKGAPAAAIHQRLLHAPDDEHRVLILATVIDGAGHAAS